MGMAAGREQNVLVEEQKSGLFGQSSSSLLGKGGPNIFFINLMIDYGASILFYA